MTTEELAILKEQARRARENTAFMPTVTMQAGMLENLLGALEQTVKLHAALDEIRDTAISRREMGGDLATIGKIYERAFNALREYDKATRQRFP